MVWRDCRLGRETCSNKFIFFCTRRICSFALDSMISTLERPIRLLQTFWVAWTLKTGLKHLLGSPEPLKWIRFQRPRPRYGWCGASGHPTIATKSRHPKRLGLVGGLTYQDASCEFISPWCLLRCLWTTASLAKGLWCDGAHEKQDHTDRFDCTQCSVGINARLA